MKGYLVLETGEVFSGKLVSFQKPRVGEIVFNTSHSGYEQIASDPSYFQQIMVMTAPMQGNYGVDSKHWESAKYWIQGFVCLEMQESSGNSGFLQDLKKAGIPILSEINTRELVLRLRRLGTVRGAVVAAESEQEALKQWSHLQSEKPPSNDWSYLVSRKEKEVRVGGDPKGPKVAVIDFGCKENILRCVQKRSQEVQIFPSRASAKEILAIKPNGVLLSNGPGDPMDVEVATETVAELIKAKTPIFGICMGHQILARAMGAKTYKLKFGHRGANHPVQDKILNSIYVTSQNHGYAVDEKTLPQNVEITHTNLYDGTIEGIRSQNCMSVQFHPESHPGPNEAEGLFDEFLRMMV